MENEILASTVLIFVLLTDGTGWWGYATVLDDHSILTAAHAVPLENLAGFEIWDASGQNQLASLNPGDSFAVVRTRFQKNQWAETARIEFSDPLFTGLPKASLAKPKDVAIGNLVGREVAQITYRPDPQVGAGRRTEVSWTEVNASVYLYALDDGRVRVKDRSPRTGLVVDQSVPHGSSGGGVYRVFGIGPVQVGVNSAILDGVTYVSFNFGIK